MPSRQDWLQSIVAPTSDALAAGDGCHPDEAKVLSDYLDGSSTTQEAAQQIIRPVSLESNPSAEVSRLWAILCEALVELTGKERQKTLDLLSAMQTLPSKSPIDWSRLDGFGHMWSDLYRLHLHGSDEWEHESLTDERKAGLCRSFEAVGTAEAEMYLRGIGGVSAEWGYEVLNLVRSRGSGLDVLLNEVHAWLTVAGTELKQSINSAETRTFSRADPDGRRGAQRAVEGTMTDLWTDWKEALTKLSEDGSFLSADGKKLAAECSAMM